MNGDRVPFFAFSKQIPLTIIAIFSCSLSFWLTVRFCARLAPGHAGIEIAVIGFIWELSKVTFGTLAIGCLSCGDAARWRSGCALALVSMVLVAGSVTASLAYFRQTGNDLSQQALHASQAYQRATASLGAMDQELMTLQGLADQDARQKFRTRSLQTLDRMSALRSERHQIAADLARLEADTGVPTAAVSVAFGPLLACAQVVLAIMLELVGILAAALLAPRTVVALPSKKTCAVTESPSPQGCSGIDWSATYIRACDMVRSSRLKPTYRAIRSALGVSQPTALSFLQNMVAEGVLCRVGRQYALATHEAVAGGAI